MSEKLLDDTIDSRKLLDDSNFNSGPPSPHSSNPKKPKDYPPVPMILRFPRGPRKHTRTKNLHTFVKRLLIYDTIVVLCGVLTFLDCFMLNTDFKNSYILVGNALNTMIMLFPMMLALPLLFAQYPMARNKLRIKIWMISRMFVYLFICTLNIFSTFSFLQRANFVYNTYTQEQGSEISDEDKYGFLIIQVLFICVDIMGATSMLFGRKYIFKKKRSEILNGSRFI